MKTDSTPWMAAVLILSLALAGTLLGQRTAPSLSSIPNTIKSSECEQWYQKAVVANANTRSPSEYVQKEVMRYSLLALACQQVKQP